MSQVSASQWWHIEAGRPLFTTGRADDGYPDRDALVRAWREHEDLILPLWIVCHPGTRPFAWWLAEGRECETLPGQEEWAANMRESDRWSKFGHLHTHFIPPCQESETIYLRRHRLLSSEEAEALGDLDGDPFAHSLDGRRDLWTLVLQPLFSREPTSPFRGLLTEADRELQAELLELLAPADRARVEEAFS